MGLKLKEDKLQRRGHRGTRELCCILSLHVDVQHSTGNYSPEVS